MAKDFSAPRWLASAHLQTLGASLPFWAPPKSFRMESEERLRIPLPGGGSLHARAWWQPGSTPRRAAILVHGVGGTSESRYVVRAAVSLHRAGFHVVRLDLRGAGDSIADAPSLYHAGLTADPLAAIEHVVKDARVDGVGLVGFSLGGHVSLKLAGEVGDAPPRGLTGVVAISAPLDLAEVTRAMERLRSLPYHYYVLRHLVRQGREFARLHPSRAHYDASRLGRLTKIRGYDALVVAPMHGFASAEDYYERASAGPFVVKIRVPTLLVHAEDDPMVPAASVRAWLRHAPASVEQVWSDRGGHVGWFGGISEASWVDTWPMARVAEFVRG